MLEVIRAILRKAANEWDWLTKAPVMRMLSEPTRRVRWIFERQLRGTGIQVFVQAVQPREYGVTNWWQHEERIIAFQNEWFKTAYYHLKY